MECRWRRSRAQCWEDVKEREGRGLSLFRKSCKLQDKLEFSQAVLGVVAASSAQAFRCKLDSCVSGMAGICNLQTLENVLVEEQSFL